jgi:hypothetical protein
MQTLATYHVPERPLTPPEGRSTEHSWTAEFTMMIGDEGQPVRVTCEVTRCGELDPDTLYVELLDHTDITALINDGHRKQITAHFDHHHDDIYGENHD